MAEQLSLALGALEGFDADECPSCGWELEGCGLDARRAQDGRVYVDWAPCCEHARDVVAAYGWQEFYGHTLEYSVEAELGLCVREVYLDDSLCRFALEGVSHVEHGEGTSRSTLKGWREEVFNEVALHHRHHKANPAGWYFGVAVHNGPVRVGVAVVGHPQSRLLQQAEPLTAEVTRVATWGDSRLRRNAASKLYGQCAREARARGCDKLVTYTLDSEDGASLRAAGFTAVHRSKGGSWDRPGRQRPEHALTAPTCPKTRWERKL